MKMAHAIKNVALAGVRTAKNHYIVNEVDKILG
jgi:hypothetical protein